jgi:predicted RNase H-like HicB family nuclease
MSKEDLNNKIEEIINKKYPAETYFIKEEDGDGYWLAFLPDFGHSACSAVGDTKQEAFEILEEVQKEVVRNYLESNKKIPEPSTSPMESNELQQIPFRAPKHTHNQLKREANKEGLSLNSYLQKIVTEHLILKSLYFYIFWSLLFSLYLISYVLYGFFNTGY